MELQEEIPLINPNRSATNIGYIYKHTSPSGKSYIGQTVRTPEIRWNQHVNNAYRNDKEATEAFAHAIRKYGKDSFTHEILLKINENMLDYYECKFIDGYNTKVPNGYNIRSGGSGFAGSTTLREKSWKYDHHPKMKHVLWYHEVNIHGTTLEGYRVFDHNRGRNKTFSDSKLTMDEKYQKAVEYKLFLDSYEGEYFNDREKLPKYVCRWKVTGYRVRYPKHPQKYIYTGNEKDDLLSAQEYLISICTGNKMFNDIFDGFDMLY